MLYLAVTDPERWLPVPGFEGFYEVSSLGRVRSVDRIVASANRWGPVSKHLRGKILAQSMDGYGYMTVTLFRRGRSRPYRVHTLIAPAFLGSRPPGQEVRHGAAGRRVNAVSNLCYGTRSQKEQDKIRDGTFNHGGGDKTAGERNGNAKLTTELVTEIRQRHADGQRQAAIAGDFGITQAAVSLVIQRKTWDRVPFPYP